MVARPAPLTASVRHLKTIMAEWGHYFCNVNGKLSSIAVDTNLKRAQPDHKRQHLVWVWLYMNNPRPDGLSSSDEFESLADIEGSLTCHLEGSCNAVLAGRITGDGRREFYFYGSAPDDLRSLVTAALSQWPDYRFDCDSQPDPNWQQYFDVLFPNDEQFECMKNIEVLGALLKEGDQPSLVREVFHYVYFKSGEDRRRFMEWSAQNGFTVHERARAGSTWEPNLMLACVARAHTTRPDDIDRHVLQVLRAAKGCGGEYDGWETSVERG